ncbi:hypothetical protein ACJX0J_014142, partial [Zea mays]
YIYELRNISIFIGIYVSRRTNSLLFLLLNVVSSDSIFENHWQKVQINAISEMSEIVTFWAHVLLNRHFLANAPRHVAIQHVPEVLPPQHFQEYNLLYGRLKILDVVLLDGLISSTVKSG